VEHSSYYSSIRGYVYLGLGETSEITIWRRFWDRGLLSASTAACYYYQCNGWVSTTAMMEKAATAASISEAKWRSKMSDRQSQAHSTHQSSFNGRFKKVLRLNRGHRRCQYLPKDDGVPRKYRRIDSVTRARSHGRRGNSIYLRVCGLLFVWTLNGP